MRIEGVLAGRVRVKPEVKVEKRQAQPQVLHKFGIGELLYVCFEPALSGHETGGEWRVVQGQAACEAHGAAFPGEARVLCPDRQQFVKIEYRKRVLNRFNEVLATVEFEVIEPGYSIVHLADDHRQSPNRDPNGGFKAAFMLTPDTVSFARVALRECGGANVWRALADLQPPAQSLNSHMTRDDHRTPDPILGKQHTDGGNTEGWAWYFSPPGAPAASYVSYLPQVARNTEGFEGSNVELIRTLGGVGGTAMFSDNVFNPIMTDAGWTWLAPTHAQAKEVAAHYYLDIPLHRKVVGRNNVKPLESEAGTLLASNRHSFKVLRDGTLTVSKGPADQAGRPSVTFAR